MANEITMTVEEAKEFYERKVKHLEQKAASLTGWELAFWMDELAESRRELEKYTKWETKSL